MSWYDAKPNDGSTAIMKLLVILSAPLVQLELGLLWRGQVVYSTILSMCKIELL